MLFSKSVYSAGYIFINQKIDTFKDWYKGKTLTDLRVLLSDFTFPKQTSIKWTQTLLLKTSVDPLTPISDQDRISPCNISTLSTR